MILNTGQRTDIPAFYSRWLVNRLDAGYVLVRNPYNPSQVTRYRLTPDVVDLIVLCTKNPAPMMEKMQALRPFRQFWQVTLTPYGREIEPHVPDKREVIRSFRRLSERVGPLHTGWRYDPILINVTYPVERHLRAFEFMARELAGATHTAVISFIDLTGRTRQSFPEARPVQREQRLALGEALVQIARRYDMELRACAEGDELARFGVDCSGCMTVDKYERVIGQRLRIPGRLPAVRSSCACYLSGDIGAYNSCGHLCRYCYANDHPELVRKNMARHDPASPLLIGHLQPGDVVREARQESWLDPQMSMDFSF